MPANRRGSVSASPTSARRGGAIDYTDIPELSDTWFETAELREPSKKEPVSIRLDPEVVQWFKQHGRGYQTRMNQVLRTYVRAQESRAPSDRPKTSKRSGRGRVVTSGRRKAIKASR